MPTPAYQCCSTFLLTLDACASAASPDGAAVARELVNKHAGNLLSVRTFRTAIRACGAGGDPKGVQQLYAKAKEAGMGGGHVANAAIVALAR